MHCPAAPTSASILPYRRLFGNESECRIRRRCCGLLPLTGQRSRGAANPCGEFTFTRGFETGESRCRGESPAPCAPGPSLFASRSVVRVGISLMWEPGCIPVPARERSNSSSASDTSASIIAEIVSVRTVFTVQFCGRAVAGMDPGNRAGLNCRSEPKYNERPSGQGAARRWGEQFRPALGEALLWFGSR